jgi:hypothetical protein
MSDEQTSGESAEVADVSSGNDSLLNVGNESTSEAQPEASWYYAENKPGEGDKPDYFIDSKFKSVEEQAKGYNELRQKLGAFTGAPEAYDVKLQKEFADKVEFNKEDPFYKSFEEFARNKNINNEAFNELLNLYSMNIIKADQQLMEQHKAQLGEEHKKLGENADQIISEVANWTKSNVPAEFHGALKDVAKTAEGVKFLQYISKNVGYTKVPTGESVANDFNKQEYAMELRNMMADSRYKQDPMYLARS